MKAAVFGASLLFCLLILEGGLRLAGFALASSRVRSFTPPYDEGGYDAEFDIQERYASSRRRRLILAFGDSLTNAGNVKSYESYPYFLYKSLADSGEGAAVYNMGYCEESTFGVARKLKDYLENDRRHGVPDAVIVLVGAADLYNLLFVRERMAAGKGPWRDMLPTSALSNLRIAKLYRFIAMNLALRAGARRAKGSAESAAENLERLLEIYAAHKKGLGADPRQPLDPAFVEELGRMFPGEVERYGADLSKISEFIELLVDQASLAYHPRLRYDEFFALLLDIAHVFPAQFWSNGFDPASYFFLQAYRVQSRFSAKDVLKEMDRAAAKHPQLKSDESYRRFRRVFADRRALDRMADGRRLKAWEEIVRLCRERGIRLVLQNYPVEYQSANRMIAQVAKKYQLPLIDNRGRFAALIAKEGRAKYLEDNDHLTPLGYEILSQNVLRTLKAEKVLDALREMP